MTSEEVLDEFRAAGALREGHFILSSGLHSEIFLQKNLVFMHPDRCERLCRALAARIVAEAGEVDLVVSPAVGAIIPGYETARHLGVPAIYLERAEGQLALRRAFTIPPGARVAVVEDVVSTGGSLRESIACAQSHGGKVVCAACIVDRSDGAAEVGAPLIALARIEVPAWPADALPARLAAIPAQEPGSRRLRA
ncbi:MAG: orotate phosphoribosyltransferase [Caulobacteraceae bacterium]